MNVEKYLKNLIQNKSEYILSSDEMKMINFEGIEKYIFQKLTSTKFRGSKLPTDLEMKVKEKIRYCVGRNLPIHISIPFGGFKKWQLPTYPDIDWAEVFNIIQLRDYLLPISKVYNKGVIVEYFSDEIFVERMNNIPQIDLEIYNNSFENLLKEISVYFPKNFTLKYSKIRDQISQKEIFKRFDNGIIQLKKEWEYLSNEEKQNRLKKSERNYKADFSNMSKEEKEKTLFESTLVHDAFIFTDWEEGVPWAFDIDMIPIGFRYTKSWGIHIKSSRSSTVQFWVGIGALKKVKSKFIPTILTYNQFLALKENFTQEKICLFQGYKNLEKIPIY